jgi:hypothetical protein
LLSTAGAHVTLAGRAIAPASIVTAPHTADVHGRQQRTASTPTGTR